MKHKDIAIRLTNVSKKYIVHHEKPTLVEKLINRKNEEFWALKDINLEIGVGERIGVIGPNGSGKTTLLKLITGISTPTSGTVKTSGKIVSLIDLEAGFHQELTGLQNIFLNGMILGMSQNELKTKLQGIINFAGIGKFIDMPIFTYSEGMKLRLGFSIAANSNPDIIILDENLAVGDRDFVIKSGKWMDSFIGSGKVVIIASHNMDLISRICSKAILLENGSIIARGTPSKVIMKYNCLSDYPRPIRPRL